MFESLNEYFLAVNEKAVFKRVIRSASVPSGAHIHNFEILDSFLFCCHKKVTFATAFRGY